VVFQHPSIEALIRELGRNPALREACGFAVLPIQKKPLAQLVPDADTGRMTIAYAAPAAAYAAVPSSWNFSRFPSPSRPPDKLARRRFRSGRRCVACGRGCPRHGVVENGSQMDTTATRFPPRRRVNDCGSVPPRRRSCPAASAKNATAQMSPTGRD
jgi:hypothetical protein